MDINTSMYTDYLNSTYKSQSANNIEKMSDKSMASKSDDELMKACKEFETYFIEQVFKEMKKSVNFTQSDDPASNTLLDYYSDELLNKYASMAADQSENGLAQMLYEQMKRNYSIEEIDAAENAAETAGAAGVTAPTDNEE